MFILSRPYTSPASRSERHLRFEVFSTALLLTCCLCLPAFAQKGKPGGGTTTLPPVRYRAYPFTYPNNSSGWETANSMGQACGWSLMPDNRRHAWYYDPLLNPTAAVDLTAAGAVGVPDGWVVANAACINNHGDVGGSLERVDEPGVLRAFVMDVSFDPEVPSRVYLLPDEQWNYTSVQALNDAGDTVAIYQTSDGTRGLYVYHTGLYDGLPSEAVEDLGVTISGSPEMNNFGEVAGTYSDGIPFRRSTDGVMESFPALAVADVSAINDLGEFCGRSTWRVKNRNQDAPFRVGATVERFESWGLYSASDINNSSDMVVGGRYLYRDDWKAVNGTGLIDVVALVTDNGGMSTLGMGYMTERQAGTNYPDFIGSGRMPDGTRRGIVFLAYPAP